jgi:hypothetical protein
VSELIYMPSPTMAKFHASDQRVRVARGPVGSGKSSAMIMELMRRAAHQAPDPRDGIRRTRGVIVRNTMPQLKSTSLKTIRELIGPIVEWEAQNHTVWIKQGDIEAEWILMPLDTPDNVQRLLSLDITYAWLSEVRELPVKILQDVLSRCGRFPSMMHGGPSWHGVIAETNSFNEDSDWNTVLEVGELDGKPTPKSWGYFVQPGAREAGAENKQNLVAGYYEDLIENNSSAWVEQYIDNKISPSLSGEAVYRSAFKKHFHVAAQELQPIPSTMIVCGIDFGRHPAAVLTQMDMRGRLVCLDEAVGDNMGVEQFIASKLRPLLSQQKYIRLPIGMVGDPSGVARGQIGEESVFNALKRLGFSSQPAQTNLIDPRLRAVEKWLLQQREGGPAMLISPTCVTLIKAMNSMYRFGRRKDGVLQPVPEKTHPWSDIADAHQYATLGHSGTVLARLIKTRHNRQANKPPSGGWT